MILFLLQVSGFSSRANGIDGDDDQDLEGEDDGLGPGVERYMLEEKWSSGDWPKYPLFIIILGGRVISTEHTHSEYPSLKVSRHS